MRKSLLALALTVAFPAAFAQMQTNGIELYGIVDIGGEFIDNGTSTNILGQKNDITINKITSGISTGSRWGIRGREDLGGGYAALFTLESRFELDTGQVRNNGATFVCSTATVPGVSTPVSSCPGVGLAYQLPPQTPPQQVAQIVGGNNLVNATMANLVSTVNGVDALFDRQAYAGLITPFGAIIAGRQYTPGYEMFVKYNSFYDSFAGNPGQISTINLRANNALQYRAELKGFTLSAMYGFGGAESVAGGRSERVAVSNGDDFWGINLQYATPNFGVAGAYQQNRTVTFAKQTENQKGLETYQVGAWVGFGSLKFYGQYLHSENENPVVTPADIQGLVISTGGNAAAITNALLSQYINRWDVNGLRGVAGPTDLDVYHLGLEWSFQSGRLLFAYNHAEDSSRSPWATADANVDSFGLAYYYYLSKRTWLYAAGGYANNKDQARVALGAACCVGGWTGNFGEDSRNIQLGMRHTF
jgi:predicted porin